MNRQQGYLEAAEKDFRSVLEDSTTEMRARGFDFSLDYEVINERGLTLFELAKQQRGDERSAARERLLHQAVEQFENTLAIDSENVTAHYNLGLLFGLLGDQQAAAEHQRLHARYKVDDNARDRAIASRAKSIPPRTPPRRPP